MPTIFNRALDPTFIEKLEVETKKESGWWVDVLDDSELFIAVRGSYLNVYWHGQSLFDVSPTLSGLNVTTHEKFLLDPALNSQVKLRPDGSFDLTTSSAGASLIATKARRPWTS